MASYQTLSAQSSRTDLVSTRSVGFGDWWKYTAPLRVFLYIIVSAIHSGSSVLVLFKFNNLYTPEFPTMIWFYASLVSIIVNLVSQILVNVLEMWPSVKLCVSGVVLSIIQAGPALQAFSLLGFTSFQDEDLAKRLFSRQVIIKAMLFIAPQLLVQTHAFIYLSYNNSDHVFQLTDGFMLFTCCFGLLALFLSYFLSLEHSNVELTPPIIFPVILRVFGELSFRTLVFILFFLKFKYYTFIFIGCSILIHLLAILWKEQEMFFEHKFDILTSVIPSLFVSRIYLFCKDSDLTGSSIYPLFDKRFTWLRFIENCLVLVLVTCIPSPSPFDDMYIYISAGASLGLWILGILVFNLSTRRI